MINGIPFNPANVEARERLYYEYLGEVDYPVREATTVDEFFADTE